MATKEPLYQLDLVLDTKRPHWSWLQEMASLYRSAIIHSNGKFKIISERDDLPVRQVFHSGNIIRERTEIRVGRDPMQVNQITGQFSNEKLDYERDILVIPDSQSLYIDNDPIKPLDLDLTGIARKSEVNRRLSVEMRRRAEIKTEMTFYTGLEGVVVEPGDVCIAGIIMTDWENGIGGRALGGSTASLLADKSVALNSGTNYDLWVWHTAADTPELRTVVGSSEVINIQPTVAFTYPVQASDRWALGVASEDLVKLLVKKVAYQEDGLTQIVGEQFVNVGFLLDCPDSAGSFDDYYDMPSNPWSISIVTSGCTLCFQMHFTAPSCIGGSTIGSMPTTPYENSAWMAVYPTTVGLPTLLSSGANRVGYLIDNTITFITGINSGLSRRILNYPKRFGHINPTSDFWAMIVSPLPNFSGSGDQYYITIDQGSNFSGFNVNWWASTAAEFLTNSRFVEGTINGNSGCIDFGDTADRVHIELLMVSPSGGEQISGSGQKISLDIPGCFAQDQRLGYSVASITTFSLTNLLAMYLPESAMSIDVGFEIKALGLLNDICASLETTKVSFGLTYAGSTIIDSLVINMRNAADIVSVGSNSPFELKAQLKVFGVPFTHVRATLGYDGYQSGGTHVTTQLLSGIINSVNFTLTQSLTMTAIISHTDTTGALHVPNTHTCAAVVLDHGEFQMLESLDS